MASCRKKCPVISLGCMMLRYPVPMATTHQLLDRWDEEKLRERRRGGVSFLLHPLGQSVTQTAITSRFTHSLPPKHQHHHITRMRHRNGAYCGADRLHLYITRLFNNAVSLTKVLTMSNERWSYVVDTGLKINGPDLFCDITSLSALKQYDTSG